MVRTFACALGLVIFAGAAFSDDKPVPAKNQMVKGTIKSINVKDNVLVVLQELKGGDKVDRQLDIKANTEFEITTDGEKKTLKGNDGLALLEGKEGSRVRVQCDKDVNVLKVSVMLKK